MSMGAFAPGKKLNLFFIRFKWGNEKEEEEDSIKIEGAGRGRGFAGMSWAGGTLTICPAC